MDRGEFIMIADGLERILSDAPLEVIDRDLGQGTDAKALWHTLAETGYPRLCAREDIGGFGAGFGDAAQLASIAGRHALALPLSDTVLAVGLLSACGVEAPDIPIALADPLDPGAPLAHAAQCEAALSINQGSLILGPLATENFEPIKGSEDGAGRLVRLPTQVLIKTPAPERLSPEVFHALAALLRAASMAGAMQAVLDLTLVYTQEREQFGRPLAKFQAIQHHLSDVACETAASCAAVEMVSDALAADPHFGERTVEEIAIAKIRCGQAAARVAAAAHQAHGAMGFTREYALGRFTRRLWQWQDEFGTEQEWAIRLGKKVLTDSKPALWPRISRVV